MNYTYEIKYSDYSPHEKKIIEYLDDELQGDWYLDFIKNPKNDFDGLHLLDSFQRTRKWASQNYPEWLL
jgi:hypothetical protein